MFSKIKETLYKSLFKNNKKDTILETIVNIKVENTEKNINIPKIKQFKK